MNTSETHLSPESQDLVPENLQEKESKDSPTQPEELQEVDYSTLSLKSLIEKLQYLIENYEIQKITKHVRDIKEAYDFELRKERKIALDQFISEGQDETNFSFESPLSKDFEKLHKKYRNEKRVYNRQFEKQLEEN
ncbi:MAG: hypothetical protein CMC18_03090, partial [Flavobacteriaceae bacterium]|nr:hypothetical protein [Flavobacteriaceae bacterium]